MTRSAPRTVIVKTSHQKAIITATLCLIVAAIIFLRMILRMHTGLGVVLEPISAVVLTGIAVYLFGLAKFRPVALRMDHDGISGYFAPPLRWESIGKIDVYKEYVDTGLFYTGYVGIEVTHTTELFAGLSRRKYDQAIASSRKTGFHILIPQLILQEHSAADVVFYATALRDAARDAK